MVMVMNAGRCAGVGDYVCDATAGDCDCDGVVVVVVVIVCW